MEEIAKTAEAYYSKLPAAEKQKVKDIFNSTDMDGNGMITYSEYRSFLDLGPLENRNFFDGDKNGALDFNEFLGWRYLVLTGRYITCNRCGMYLPGMFFSCTLCFYNSDTTFNLCSSCYKNCDSISHRHSTDMFLGNYALLLLTRKIPMDQQHEQQKDQVVSCEYHVCFQCFWLIVRAEARCKRVGNGRKWAFHG